MAATVLSDLSAALSLRFANKAANQINNVTVLPHLLPIIPGDGKVCSWTVEVSGATDAVPSDEAVPGRTHADADAEIELPAIQSWSQYDKTTSISDLAQAASAANFNPESAGAQGMDMLIGKLMRQLPRMAKGIARDCYSGTSAAAPAGIVGLEEAIDSGATAYAGINPVTYPEWTGVENVGTYAGLSLSFVRENLLTPVYDACGESPEFMVCGSAMFDRLRGLFPDSHDKYFDREIALARGGGPDGREPRMLKLHSGVVALEIDGVPVVRDKFCTPDTIYALNTSYIELRQVLPYYGLLQQGQAAILDLFRRITDNPRLQLPRETLEGMAARTPGIVPHIKLLGDSGLSTEAVVCAWPQLCVTRRNAQGKLTLS